jgi:hypothetical protein
VKQQKQNRVQLIISSNNNRRNNLHNLFKVNRHSKLHNLLKVSKLQQMVNLLKVNLVQHLNLFVQNSVKPLMKKFKQQKKQQGLILLA